MKDSACGGIERRAVSSGAVVFMAAVCFVLDILRSVIDTQSSSAYSHMLSPSGDRSARAAQNTALVYLLLCVTAAAAELVTRCVSALVFSRSFSIFFQRLYTTFLRTKWTNWQPLLRGNVYDIINRRAEALATIADRAYFRLLNHVVYLLFVLYGITGRVTAATSFLVLGAVLLYLLLCFAVQSLKGRINVVKSRAEDLLYEKSLDMQINCDLLHLNGRADIAMAEYCACLERYIFYMRADWLANCALDALKTVYVTAARVLLLLYTISHGAVPSYEVKFILKIVRKVFTTATAMTVDLGEIAYLRPLAYDDRFAALAKEDASAFKLHKEHFLSAITVSNLSHCYAGRVLYSGVSFSIRKGARLAITGANGSGKTTLVKQLLGLLDSERCVSIDNVQLEALDAQSRARLMAYVPQESQLFHGSILDNIRCGDRSITGEDALACCRASGLHAELKKVGYDHVITNGGANIADAHKQAVALARALIKDAPIVLIDELNLSPRVFAHMFSLYPDKTFVVITHDMDMLQHFEQILFYSEGGYSLLGTAEHALANDGAFAKYYSANA
ncbi:hypothetical protein PAPHI01_0290 [Pancytospora philotis]|nr:hypothetical protein PAPHI01_0290 [Pancytospora philotis]